MAYPPVQEGSRKAEALSIEREGLTLKAGRPVRLEPRRPFAEALVWHLMDHLRGQGGGGAAG